MDRSLFPPTTPEDCLARGWSVPDFVYVIGDAYVDHPSFGSAIITRLLEKAGYHVAVCAQPDWRTDRDLTRFGRPAFGFLVSSGVIDSMVNHYSVAKHRRARDVYSPGGRSGRRPDRALTVYCRKIREIYGDIPIAAGGIEAALRRFSHYDYWSDSVMPSVLADTGADVLMFGMGERTILEVADWMSRGAPEWERYRMRGICYFADKPPANALIMPSHEECCRSREAYGKAFLLQYEEQDPFRGHVLAQQHGDRVLVQNLPDTPLSREELDAVYELPFTRTWHPDYDAAGGVPAIEEVRFSIAHTRGCFGACSFCAITFLQGRIVTSRSHESVLEEARRITQMPDFKGYIHDVGGPTANFRHPSCEKQLRSGTCKNRQCLFPNPCPNLKVDHTDYLELLHELRKLPGVKKVFIRSGLRYDYIMADRSGRFLRELCEHHVSGQLKVAPEHVNDRVLALMGKPSSQVYRRFCEAYERVNASLHREQYLVPYFISSHPGSDLPAAVELAEYLRDIHHQPEQVQDFYPTPGTLSTCMFYTGQDPRTGKKVYVARSPREKAMQRALLQYRRPENYALVRAALEECRRTDLIGYGPRCLIPPYPVRHGGRGGGGREEAPRRSHGGTRSTERVQGRGKPRR